MAFEIKPSTSIERKNLFIETLINATNKVSKVSENSVLSGVANGIAKVAGKAEKDIVVATSQLFPDQAYDILLDKVANNFGISPRLGAIGSSTYLRIVAEPGTFYQKDVNIFSSSKESFELESDFTVTSLGYGYVRVKSLSVGESTNVEALTITKVSPQPNGHKSVVNEYRAEGGREVESDVSFRNRIKESPNILARGTVAMLEQVFIKINPKVLKVINQGSDTNGSIVLAIVTQNGTDLSTNELNEILSRSANYFNLTENKSFGRRKYGIVLTNVEYQPIDISFRLEVEESSDVDSIRISIQNEISKYLDYRFFDPLKQKVEWDNLLEICKNTPGVRYVADQYFYPRIDIAIDPFKLPRVRSFLMLDKEGQVISNYSGTLSPLYYPNVVNDSYQTILKNVIE